MKRLLCALLTLSLLFLCACNDNSETEHSNIPEEFVFPQISQYDSVIESEEERQALYEKYVNFPKNYKSVIRFFATWKTENLWNSVSRRSPFGFLVTEEITKDGVTKTTTKLYTEKLDSAVYEFPLRGEELYTKYALNPEDVFSESVTVYNTYCISRDHYGAAIYYTTDKGNYYLFAHDLNVYLFPQDKMIELEARHREYMDNLEQDLYGHPSPIESLTDEEKDIYFKGVLDPIYPLGQYTEIVKLVPSS